MCIRDRQDTLTHLVENTIARNDSSKFLFILNQIDTAAREDNTEEIVGAWQRALSQKGLTAGRFYTVYNKDLSLPIDDEALKRRFEEKRDTDMRDIEERIRQVEVERAYRIVGAMEQQAYAIRDKAIPAITRLKQLWSRRVLRGDLLVLGLLAAGVVGVSLVTGGFAALASLVLSLFSDPVAMLSTIIVLALLVVVIHFVVRKLVTEFMAKRLEGSDDEPYTKAFRFNTRFYRSVFSHSPVGWGGRSKKAIDEVLEHATDFVESLNDQFTNPSGQSRVNKD